MNPTDIIAILISIGVITCAVLYIVKQKKKGTHCIGCPDSATCSHHSCPGCHKENRG